MVGAEVMKDEMPRELLVTGGTIVTMDTERRIYPNGFVHVRGAEIASLGTRVQPSAQLARERIDATGCVVVPGLINTHQHHWYNLFKGLGGGMLLEQWIQNLLAPTAAAIGAPELEASSRLACLEMLGTGTTACLNHSVTATDHEAVEATLRPVVEAGMRQLFAKEVRPQGLDEQLALAEEVHGRWNGAADGRIAIGLVLESTAHWVAMGTSSEELLVRGDELAGRLGARISDHVAGGTMSREHGYLRFVLEMGRTDIEFLQGLGILDPKWILAHAIHARDRDIELIGASGASVSHTPTSESARGGGITPVRRMRDAGIRVHLGSDGPMVDTSVDMVEQMKAVTLFQNQLHRDPTAIEPVEALAMATCDAAQALGIGEHVGSLEVGKRADLAIFDLATPHAGIWHEPLAALVGSAKGLDARWVLVDGEPLVADGRFVRFDQATLVEIIGEARTRATELLERSDVPAQRVPTRRSSLPSIV